MAKGILIPNARLSFPSLFKKTSFQGTGANEKFEATFLFPKTDKKTYKALIDAIEECKTEAKLGKLSPQKICIKDGDESEYDGYEGMWSVKATNSKRPTVLNRDKTPLTEEDEVIYAGCYVDAIVAPWAQDNEFGKRVNANLLGVRFVKDGEPFGDAVVASADDFDDLEDEEEL